MGKHDKSSVQETSDSLGVWNQFDPFRTGDAAKFEWGGGDQQLYNSMTPEERAEYKHMLEGDKLDDVGTRDGLMKGNKPGQDWTDYMAKLRAAHGGPAVPEAGPAEEPKESLYAKLLSGVGDLSGSRQSAIDAAYGQATSRLDPMWENKEESMRTRLLNQGLDPDSEASRNASAQFGRDRNDAYTSAQRNATLLGNEESHNVLKDKLQAWLAENNDELTRAGILKGDQADQTAGAMALLSSIMAMI